MPFAQKSAPPTSRCRWTYYHAQIVEGDLSMTLKNNFEGIGHIQIASVPNRHEPDAGEVNYRHLFVFWMNWATAAGSAASIARAVEPRTGWCG